MNKEPLVVHHNVWRNKNANARAFAGMFFFFCSFLFMAATRVQVEGNSPWTCENKQFWYLSTTAQTLAALCQLSLHLPASELINPAKLPPPDTRTLISGKKISLSFAHPVRSLDVRCSWSLTPVKGAFLFFLLFQEQISESGCSEMLLRMKETMESSALQRERCLLGFHSSLTAWILILKSRSSVLPKSSKQSFSNPSCNCVRWDHQIHCYLFWILLSPAHSPLEMRCGWSAQCHGEMTSLERSHDHHGTNVGRQTITHALDSYLCATWRLSSHHVVGRLSGHKENTQALHKNRRRTRNRMTTGSLFPFLMLLFMSRQIFFSFVLILNSS